MSSKEGIANSFMSSFRCNSTPNNIENVRKLEDKFHGSYAAYVAEHTNNCDCKSIYISNCNVIDVLFCMKKFKSANEDHISIEHIHHAPLDMLVRLIDLFNSMLRH